METIHLVGSEDVRAAGSQISSAADNISRAASSFDSSIDVLRRVLEEHASRIEAALIVPQQNVELAATDSQQLKASIALLLDIRGDLDIIEQKSCIVKINKFLNDVAEQQATV